MGFLLIKFGHVDGKIRRGRGFKSTAKFAVSLARIREFLAGWIGAPPGRSAGILPASG